MSEKSLGEIRPSVDFSPDKGKTGGGPEAESGQPRDFITIQKEIKTLIKNPDPEKERELRIERAKLLRDAKDAGIFSPLKNWMLEVQTNNDFEQAYKKIAGTNIDRLEQEAESSPNWDTRFEGALEEYRDVACLNMKLAYLNATSQGNTDTAKSLRREIEIRGWGNPPEGLERLALDYLVSQQEQEEEEQSPAPPPPTPPSPPPSPPPLPTPGMNFTPEEFARAMGQASPEEQREIYLKAEETIGAPIQMQLEVPKFLLDTHLSIDQRERAQKEWRARAQLITMAYTKRTAPSCDKLFPNEAAIDFTGEQLETLLCMPSVLEAASIHLVNIAKTEEKDGEIGPKDISEYRIPNPAYDSSKKKDKNNKEYIASIFEIKTGEQLALYRERIRQFLQRDRKLTEEQARDAEQVAWNLLYVSNVFEEFDVDGAPPNVPQLKSQAMWMMMHPQRRLEKKVEGSEAWGVYGEWAVNKLKTQGKPKFKDDVLPKILFKNALRDIKFGSINKNLFEILLENGEKLDENPKAGVAYARNLPWGEIEGPFGSYYFDTISPAIKVFNVIAKGEDKDSDLIQLGNALRKLNVENKYRENLLMGWFGIRRKSRKLTPAMGGADWKIFKQQLKKYAPNFFK